jgi:hypothetical protein
MTIAAAFRQTIFHSGQLPFGFVGAQVSAELANALLRTRDDREWFD